VIRVKIVMINWGSGVLPFLMLYAVAVLPLEPFKIKHGDVFVCFFDKASLSPNMTPKHDPQT